MHNYAQVGVGVFFSNFVKLTIFSILHNYAQADEIALSSTKKEQHVGSGLKISL